MRWPTRSEYAVRKLARGAETAEAASRRLTNRAYFFVQTVEMTENGDERMRDEMVLFGLKVKNGRRWYSIDERDWRAMTIGETALPGFFWIPVAEDENGAWTSYWMRLQPGARSLEHQHDSTELILILDGVFTDDDGSDFLPGQTVTYPAGSRHSTSSEEGCTVLVVAHTGSKIVSQTQGTDA